MQLQFKPEVAPDNAVRRPPGHAESPDSGGQPVMACEDNLAFMQRLEDARLQMKLIVTSPPYNLGKDYETKSSLDEYLASQTDVIKQCVRLLHPEGSICWQVGNFVDDGEVIPLDVLLYPIFRAEGLKLRNRIVWHFGHGLHASKRLSGRYETDQLVDQERRLHLEPRPNPSPCKVPGQAPLQGSQHRPTLRQPQGQKPQRRLGIPQRQKQSP